MEADSSSDVIKLYRAAVGESKADYYVPKFLSYDQAGANRISWNWPAFFVSFFWMLYRRMYGPALLYFFVLPILLVIFGVIVMTIFGEDIGALIYVILAIGVPFIAMPMFANALYHWHIKKRIAALSVTAPSQEAVVERLIGQSAVAGPGLVVVIVLVSIVPVIGILAAIAIPAYQDYTIRAQVSEGLILTTPVKAALTESFTDDKAWPATLADAGFTEGELEGKYVESIDIDSGVILIRYGKAANRLIAGGTLTLTPAMTQDESIRWRCGYNTAAGAIVASESTARTDIKPKYLPSSCRAE